jgi:hypothetical protein
MGKISRAMKIRLDNYCLKNKNYILACAENSMFGEELESICVCCEEETQAYEHDIRYGHCENCETYGVFAFEELMFEVAK